MREVTFTLKTGTEVAERFNGATIPYRIASTIEDVTALAGSTENVVHMFNRAYALDLQKDVKTIANADESTLDTLRERAAGYKVGELRPRYMSDGTPRKVSSGKVKVATEKASVLDEILAANPDLRNDPRFAERLAKLNAAVAAAPAPVAKSDAPAVAKTASKTAAKGGK